MRGGIDSTDVDKIYLFMKKGFDKLIVGSVMAANFVFIEKGGGGMREGRGKE